MSAKEVKDAAKQMAINIAAYQTAAIHVMNEAKAKVTAILEPSAILQHDLLSLMITSPKSERKAIAKAVVSQLKKGRVNMGELSSTFGDMLSQHTGEHLYPTPWKYDKLDD